MAKTTAVDQLPLLTKRCCRCRGEKPLEAFGRLQTRPDGLQPRCRECQAIAHQEWKARNLTPERRAAKRAYDRQHRRDNPEYYAAKGRERREKYPNYAREYYLANREKYLERGRERQIRKNWGMSVVEYDAILARGCAICGATSDEAKLCLDHDHDDGRIRDALCSGCNVGIGNLNDDPKRLRAAADYLERHGK